MHALQPSRLTETRRYHVGGPVLARLRRQAPLPQLREGHLLPARLPPDLPRAEAVEEAGVAYL